MFHEQSLCRGIIMPVRAY